MPDTGAPHFIPFLDGTELVRAYPDFSEDLADAVADGLSAAGNAGIGSNVVQTVKTNTFSTSNATFTAVTGLSATITPTSATNKVLVIASYAIGYGTGNGRQGGSRIVRGATPVYVGDTEGNRAGGLDNLRWSDAFANLTDRQMLRFTAVFVDSPETTAATTYALEVRAESSGIIYINRTANDGNAVAVSRGASSIVLIEVDA